MCIALQCLTLPADDVVGEEEEEEEERGAGSPEALPAFTLLQAAQRRERAHVE